MGLCVYFSHQHLEASFLTKQVGTTRLPSGRFYSSNYNSTMKIIEQFKNLLWGKSLLSKIGGIAVVLVIIYFAVKIIGG